MSQGRASGIASVAGVAAGNLGNALAASIGLGALFALSSAAFALVKYAGAVYLIYLGVQTLRRPQHDIAVGAPEPMRLRRMALDGFLVALLNPKTTLFFAAFLPQFISGAGAPMLQSAVLGATFVAIAAVTDSAYALAAGSLASAVLRGTGIRRLGRYLGAGTLIGLGISTALARSSK
jgi:threonine/homoserine/homoserine lactone efflux protein